MPRYQYRVCEPSRADFELWQSTGFTGTYAQYEQAKRREYGGLISLHGDLGPHCADCSGVGDFLCDYPVGDGKTCDRPMCDRHVTVIGPEMHYCKAHAQAWNQYKTSQQAQERDKNSMPTTTTPTTATAKLPTGKVHQIRTLQDLLTLDADEFSRLLPDLCQWFNFMRRASSMLNIPTSETNGLLVWTDDGRNVTSGRLVLTNTDGSEAVELDLPVVAGAGQQS